MPYGKSTSLVTQKKRLSEITEPLLHPAGVSLWLFLPHFANFIVYYYFSKKNCWIFTGITVGRMIRTLHCSANTTNYNLCIEYKVAGFTHRRPETGDIIYLVYKNGKKSLCGARFELDQITDEKPWDDADNYVLCYSFKNLEFCNFFDMSFLSGLEENIGH